MQYYFVFALFLFKVADAGYTCPNEEGLFPHMTRCGWFIQCMNWYPYVFECPSGLHFDQTKKLCDWPSQAGCTLEEQDAASQTETAPAYRSGSEDEAIPDESDSRSEEVAVATSYEEDEPGRDTEERVYANRNANWRRSNRGYRGNRRW